MNLLPRASLASQVYSFDISFPASFLVFVFFPNVVVTLSEYRKNARRQSNPTQRAEIFARFTVSRHRNLIRDINIALARSWYV